MIFSEILKGVTEEVKGGRGAVVVGMDGIIVDEYVKTPGMDLQSIGAEYGNILKGVQRASISLNMGGAKEMAVMADSCGLVLRKINEEYFLALLMSPNANLGKGRFALRMAANKLEKEL
ncbi:MAG: roadblock/LC7 domain-containing protein [Nitrospirota bacterium]